MAIVTATGPELNQAGPGSVRSGETSQWALAWRYFRRRRMGMVALVLLTILVGAAVLVPAFSPFNYKAFGTVSNQPMGSADVSGQVHWLGTNEHGTDLLVLLFAALRTTLALAVPAAIASVLIGVALGAAAGYYGGLLDAVLSRVADLMLSLPALPAYLFFGQLLRRTFLGSDLGGSSEAVIAANVPATFSVSILVFTLFSWMSVYRLVRASVFSLRERPFIEAARALGAGNRRIIFKHLLPNSLSPVIVAGIFILSDLIIAMSILSYMELLGLTQDSPNVTANTATGSEPSLGGLLAMSNYVGSMWFIIDLDPSHSMRAYSILLPNLLILLVALSINYIGDAVRYSLDPHRHF